MVDARKADESDYDPSTINGYMSNFDRRLKDKGYSYQVNKGHYSLTATVVSKQK